MRATHLSEIELAERVAFSSNASRKRVGGEHRLLGVGVELPATVVAELRAKDGSQLLLIQILGTKRHKPPRLPRKDDVVVVAVELPAARRTD